MLWEPRAGRFSPRKTAASSATDRRAQSSTKEDAAEERILRSALGEVPRGDALRCAAARASPPGESATRGALGTSGVSHVGNAFRTIVEELLAVWGAHPRRKPVYVVVCGARMAPGPAASPYWAPSRLGKGRAVLSWLRHLSTLPNAINAVTRPAPNAATAPARPARCHAHGNFKRAQGSLGLVRAPSPGQRPRVRRTAGAAPGHLLPGATQDLRWECI